MAIIIPIERETEDAAHFDLQAILDGVTYTLEFRWNVRLEAWFMNIWDADEEVLYAAGLRLVANWHLRRYTIDRSPPGDFALVDTANTKEAGEDPGFADLGTRHQLLYESLDEL